MRSARLFAVTAVTTVTVQNALGVSGAHPIPTVAAQIESVVTDIGLDVVKTGMGDHGGVRPVRDRWERSSYRWWSTPSPRRRAANSFWRTRLASRASLIDHAEP